MYSNFHYFEWQDMESITFTIGFISNFHELIFDNKNVMLLNSYNNIFLPYGIYYILEIILATDGILYRKYLWVVIWKISIHYYNDPLT